MHFDAFWRSTIWIPQESLPLKRALVNLRIFFFPGTCLFHGPEILLFRNNLCVLIIIPRSPEASRIDEYLTRPLEIYSYVPKSFASNLVEQLGCRGEPLPQVRCCNQRCRDRLSRACCDYVASIELSLVTRKREKKKGERERAKRKRRQSDDRSLIAMGMKQGVALENSTSTSQQDLQSYPQQPAPTATSHSPTAGHYIYQQSHSPVPPQSPVSIDRFENFYLPCCRPYVPASNT